MVSRDSLKDICNSATTEARGGGSAWTTVGLKSFAGLGSDSYTIMYDVGLIRTVPVGAQPVMTC